MKSHRRAESVDTLINAQWKETLTTRDGAVQWPYAVTAEYGPDRVVVLIAAGPELTIPSLTIAVVEEYSANRAADGGNSKSTQPGPIDPVKWSYPDICGWNWNPSLLKK